MADSAQPGGVTRAIADLRDHIARCDPASVWVTVCDEWLHFLARQPCDPVVVQDIRHDLGRGGALVSLRLASDNRKLEELRARLAREIEQLPFITEGFYLSASEINTGSWSL